MTLIIIKRLLQSTECFFPANFLYDLICPLTGSSDQFASGWREALNWLMMFDIFIIFKLPSLCLPSFRPFFVKYNSPFEKKGPQPLKSGLHLQQTLIGEFTKLTQLLSTSFISKNVDCRLSCQTRYYYYFSGRLREKNILV